MSVRDIKCRNNYRYQFLVQGSSILQVTIFQFLIVQLQNEGVLKFVHVFGL